MIRRPDWAFPRSEAAAFWLIARLGDVSMASFLVPGGPGRSGWFVYPPVSLQNPLGFLSNPRRGALDCGRWGPPGVSSIMGANQTLLTTISCHAGAGDDPVSGLRSSAGTALSAQIIQLIGLRPSPVAP